MQLCIVHDAREAPGARPGCENRHHRGRVMPGYPLQKLRVTLVDLIQGGAGTSSEEAAGKGADKSAGKKTSRRRSSRRQKGAASSRATEASGASGKEAAAAIGEFVSGKPITPMARPFSSRVGKVNQDELQQFLQLQAKLELENAEIWGEPAWSQAAIRVASGDRLFGERRFADATLAYSEALQKLQELQGKRERFLDAALDLGQRHLPGHNLLAASRLVSSET